MVAGDVTEQVAGVFEGQWWKRLLLQVLSWLLMELQGKEQ